MPQFSRTILDFWQTPFGQDEVLYREERFNLFINPELDDESCVTVLKTADGKTNVALTPAIADLLRLPRLQSLSEPDFRRMLNSAGIVLHGADHLYYFAEPDKAALLQRSPDIDVRRLTADDADIFADFQAEVSEQDLDDAYVELDHWAVFGVFADDRLVAAASAYPWHETSLADLGVLTQQAFRGHGHGRKLVHAICRHAYGVGYEPQYRCQFDHHVSQRLAKAAGLTLFGSWEAPSPAIAETEGR